MMGTYVLWAKGSRSIPGSADMLDQEKAQLAFLSKTHLASSQVPLYFQMGLAQALAWDEPTRTRLH